MNSVLTTFIRICSSPDISQHQRRVSCCIHVCCICWTLLDFRQYPHEPQPQEHHEGDSGCSNWITQNIHIEGACHKHQQQH